MRAHARNWLFWTGLAQLLAGSALAVTHLRSPIRSSLPGMHNIHEPSYLPNAHAVTVDGSEPSSARTAFAVVRGMMPWAEDEGQASAQINFLRASARVTDVLIFRALSNESLAGLMELYKKSEFAESHVKYIPFKFKDDGESCAQAIAALIWLRTVESAGGRTFVQCSVGEDRTGWLATLYRVVRQPDDFWNIWELELCERGYASANPYKPRAVVAAAEGELTPLFVKIYAKIRSGALSWDKLDPAICGQLPPINDALAALPGGGTLASLRCASSSRMVARPDDDPNPFHPDMLWRKKGWTYRSDDLALW